MADVKQYHILNGDALADQFPETLHQEKIILRECLVDGPVKGHDLEAFFQNRAEYLNVQYDVQKLTYRSKSAEELRKLTSLESNSIVNLWFEDDLFCQVNLWFAIHLINLYHDNITFYLIRPKQHSQYGFGGLSEGELLTLFNQKQPLTEISLLHELWPLYQKGDVKRLLDLGKKLQKIHPYILQAIQAHADRIPTENRTGRPRATLLSLIQELDTTDFTPIFNAFSQRESIYGFGDIQVKRLLEEVLNDKP